MAILVLYVYDYLITLPEEVAHFWRAKPTGATVLFFLARYTTLACLLVEFVIGFISYLGTVRLSCHVSSDDDADEDYVLYRRGAPLHLLRPAFRGKAHGFGSPS